MVSLASTSSYLSDHYIPSGFVSLRTSAVCLPSGRLGHGGEKKRTMFIQTQSPLGKALFGIDGLPKALSVRIQSAQEDYSSSNVQSGNLSNLHIGNTLLFPLGNTKHWLVRMDKPGIGVVTKAQMADYYAQILAKVLRNEKDAQMCIYHMSWQSNFGFCCELDEECAQELAGVPGVLSVHPDKNFESENKDYGGNNMQNLTDVSFSAEASQISPVDTKKLFVTGLSFYTSEKTLRAAFESFGELVEVKIIMDKISKRSKGYAFIEYTTKEAASAALKEMNGKIINGWMIVVDVAKTSPTRHNNQGRRRDEGSLRREVERGR